MLEKLIKKEQDGPDPNEDAEMNDVEEIQESKEEVAEEDEADSLIRGNVFKNPEILKMHLDILYKTVSFLDKIKINETLPQYLENKKARQ